MIKLNIIGRRKPGTTLEEHRKHIRMLHGEEVLRYIETDPKNAPLRYVQNVVLDGRYRASRVADDPLALNRDFVTQVWVEDFAALEHSRNTEFYNTRLRDDEDAFVDQANVVFLPCHERILNPGSQGSQGRYKVLVLYRRTKESTSEDFERHCVDAAKRINRATLRHVQNTVLPIPGQTQLLVDTIDEFWTYDKATARSVLREWCNEVETHFIADGLVIEGSLLALLALEDVVYAGNLPKGT